MNPTSILTRLTSLALAVILVLSSVGAVSYDDNGESVTVIVLDPGHGGIDTGAEAKYDGETICESHLNLKIAGYCRDYLEEHYQGIRVLMTREEDVQVTLESRMAFAIEQSADFVLSIHLNSNDGSARGALAIVPRGIYRPEQGAASQDAATAILEELASLGLTDRGFLTTTTDSTRYPDGTRKDGFMIVRSCVEANIPGIIMEQAFLDSSSDYRSYLSSEEKLEALGIANALGLARSLGLEEKRKPSSADAGDTPFTDVYQGDWFYDDVTYVWDLGLMEGIDPDTFGPAMTANRAMVVTLLYRLDGGFHSAVEPTFTDVPEGVWYYDPVEWAVENGITLGVSETQFAPGRNVIREQFVTFLYRYAALLGCDLKIYGDPVFTDSSDISQYAREAVRWAAERKLVTGYEDGTFRPLRELNRAELAVLMHRFHRYLRCETGELAYEWTLSHTGQDLFVGESFDLTLTNQFGVNADIVWTADTEGVVEISGSTITAIAPGETLLSAELDGVSYDCLVTVEKKADTWTISHTDVTIQVGESFYLKLRNQDGETAAVTWTASKSGYVTISGNKITGKAKGTVTVSCELDGTKYSCIVRVKSA